MIELGNKDIKTGIITKFHIFKKLEERLSMLNRVMEDIKETQIKLLEMQITVVWDGKIYWMGLMAVLMLQKKRLVNLKI